MLDYANNKIDTNILEHRTYATLVFLLYAMSLLM